MQCGSFNVLDEALKEAIHVRDLIKTKRLKSGQLAIIDSISDIARNLPEYVSFVTLVRQQEAGK